MSAIQSIVVPVDFHIHSHDLADFAEQIGHSLKAEIIYLHVAPELPDTSEIKPETILRMENKFLEAAQNRMAQFLKTRQDRGSTVRGEVVVGGECVEAILAFAGKVKADLIVISTHGNKGIEAILLGSVADRVIKKAHCPVLIFNPFHRDRGYPVCAPLNECLQPSVTAP